MLYLVIHSSASQRPWVRIPDTTLTSFRSIWIHWYWSLNLDSHAHLTKINSVSFLSTCSMCAVGRRGLRDSPKALIVEASLVGDPGGVPAGVLVLIGAADLVWGHRSRFKAQRPVVWAFCGGQCSRVTVALDSMNYWNIYNSLSCCDWIIFVLKWLLFTILMFWSLTSTWKMLTCFLSLHNLQNIHHLVFIKT